MNWNKLIKLVNDFPQCLQEMDAIVVIDTNGVKCKSHNICEISTKGLGGVDYYYGKDENDPLNNDLFSMRVWTEPTLGSKQSYLTLSWGEFVQYLNELPKHFRELDTIVEIDTDGHNTYQCYEIREFCSINLVEHREMLGQKDDGQYLSNAQLIFVKAEPIEFESAGSLLGLRAKKIENILSN